MYKPSLRNTVEIMYVGLMKRWADTAPPDKHLGQLDGKPERNSQISRMAFILQKIAAGNEEHVYQTLAVHSRRDDSESYVSRNPNWMERPYPLNCGWHFEGCTSLQQKKLILQGLSKLALSAALIDCIEDFVEHNNVDKHIPSLEEQDAILQRCLAEDPESGIIFKELNSEDM